VLRLLTEAKQAPKQAVLKLCQSVLFLGLRDQVSHQQKTYEAFKISHTLIFTFVENTPEDKSHGLNVDNNFTK